MAVIAAGMTTLVVMMIAVSVAGMTTLVVMMIAVSVAGMTTFVVMIAFYVGVVFKCARNICRDSFIGITRNAAAECYSLVGKCHLRATADSAANKHVNAVR